MDFKDIIGKVIDVASPFVSAFVPGGSLISTGVKVIANAFGIKESEVTPEKLQEFYMQDKDFALKMKQADQMFQLEIIKNETEQLKLQLADVQSARNMNVETTKATGKRDINLYTLAWIIVIGFFGLVGLLIFKEIPKDSNGVIYLLFGALAAGFSSVLGYFFGSSKGSSDKTDIIAKAEPIK